MRSKILLVTTVIWPSAARLAGAFAGLGASVEAVFPAGHALKASRYLDRGWRYHVLDGAGSIAKAIAGSNPDHVIACDDRALSLLLSLPDASARLERTMGPLASYRILTARVASIAAARAEGVLAPLTVDVPDQASLPAALAEVGLPCVVKADGSWGGGGVKFATTEAEAARAFTALEGPPHILRSLARALRRRDAHFLLEARHPRKARVSVQVQVNGTPATTAFAARDGKVLASLHMDVLASAGRAGPASMMARVDCPQMQAAAEAIAARFGLSGLIGLDFMRDAAGNAHLIEVNPRATQICHLPLTADLPAALLGAVPREPATSGRQIALFPQLLDAECLPPTVYQDIPWDDPGVLRAVAGEALPEACALESIAEFVRPGGGPPILRKSA